MEGAACGVDRARHCCVQCLERPRRQLRDAARDDSFFWAKFALFIGADVNAGEKGYCDGAALKVAIERESSLEMVRFLGELDSVRSGTKREALVTAVKNSRFDVVEVLLDVGVNKGVLNAALFAAVRHSNFKMVKTLIEAGAVVNAKNLPASAGNGAPQTEPWSPLMLAIKEVRGKPTEEQVRCKTAREKHDYVRAHTVMELLEAGANFEREDGRGLTPLMLAAMEGGPYVIATLVDAGANVNRKSRHGETPLMLAAEFDYYGGTIIALIKLGANLKAKNKFGETPRSIAQKLNTKVQKIFFAADSLSLKKQYAELRGLPQASDKNALKIPEAKQIMFERELYVAHLYNHSPVGKVYYFDGSGRELKAILKAVDKSDPSMGAAVNWLVREKLKVGYPRIESIPDDWRMEKPVHWEKDLVWDYSDLIL